MRWIGLSLLPASFALSLSEPLLSGPFDGLELSNPDPGSDVPISPSESIDLTEAHLDAQSASQSLFLDLSGSSEEVDDLFGIQSEPSISNNPLSSIDPDAVSALRANANELQANLPSNDGSSYIWPSSDLGENLNDFINEGVNRGVNDFLQFLSPLARECELKTRGRLPLCCTSNRKALPRAYGCYHFDSSDYDCKFYAFQFCCQALNPVDAEGIDCTQGFYIE